MKTFKTFLFISAILLLTACNDDDMGIIATDGELTATIGGQQFTFDSAGGVLDNTGLAISAFRTNVDNQGELLTIIISNPSEGTFLLSESNETFAGYTIGTDLFFSTLFEDGSGEITISNLDMQNNTASGSFEFDALRFVPGTDETETIQIRNGSFTNIILQ